MIPVVRGGPLVAVSWCGGILALVVLAAGCNTALPPAYLVRAHSDAVYLVVEQSGAASLRLPSDPVDPSVPDTGGNAYASPQPLTGGLTNALARLQGQSLPAPVSFTATANEVRYVDLSQAITGTVWVSTSLSTARPVDNGIYRINLRVNGVMAGGQDFGLEAAAAAKDSTDAFAPIHFSFGPEFHVIRPGDKVALEVTQLSGLADLKIGAGGAHQSHARIQTYKFDPIAGATYLERNKLVIQDPNSNMTGAMLIRAAEAASRAGAFEVGPAGLYFLPDSPATPDLQGPGLALGAVFLLPLVWTSAREVAPGRRQRLLAIALALAFLLAGCADKKGSGHTGDNSDLPPEARPSVDTTVEDIIRDGPKTAPGEVGIGEITGAVRDWRNLTMTGAYVAVLGTSNFAETDSLGRFAFANLTAGKYVVRVDAVDMRSIEERVEVFANKRTILTIKMAPLDPTVPDRFAHIHDEWGGQTEKAILETKFTPATHGGYTAGESVASGGAPLCVPWYTSGVDGRLNDDYCAWEIPIEVGAKVPPGAGSIDVILTWTGDAKEMGVRAYLLATRPVNNGTFLARGSGQTTHITFFPNEADPGHQTFTNWAFFVYIPTSDLTTLGQKPLIDVGDITVKAVARRTVIPFEPGHPDLWQGGDRIVLFDNGATSSAAYFVPDAAAVFKPGKGLFVPGDAKRIEGTFRVDPATQNGVAQTYGLSYKASNIPSARWQENLVAIPLQGSFPTYTFSFEVPAGGTDQPYQTTSNFHFYPTAENLNYRGGATMFYLDASVYKK